MCTGLADQTQGWRERAICQLLETIKIVTGVCVHFLVDLSHRALEHPSACVPGFTKGLDGWGWEWGFTFSKAAILADTPPPQSSWAEIQQE